MPSHLRNGKDLSFEQLRAAEQAAKRDAERVRQQQQLTEIASCHSAVEQPSDRLGQYNQLPSVSDQVSAGHPPSPVGKSSAADYHSPSGDQPTFGYTFSPAALERLRQTCEQQLDVHGSGQDRPARDGAGLPARPGNGSFGSILPSPIHDYSVPAFDTSPPSGVLDFKQLEVYIARVRIVDYDFIYNFAFLA
ncbi:hypothetical protein PCANC_01227 [Puccinia coronata f. sp. avenae]|uniref:Uncharacterized protein n=1 Tax=Puccinia coronata f. sp. avenae TaxID=200324 RepID=A0A2N5W3Y0_9BASI|nr:hypothetical protein PCANC_01227 [Puccinia coronata f. sp. avenae]